jgi:23S rRNA (cytidine1920-2'-O)/16S rRNA (cytidine1409-2'-O)-methyltransferase
VPPKRQRLDDALVERELAETRARARALVLAGDVLVDSEVVRTAGKPVRPEQVISLRARQRFVSRGGEKLDHALATFGIDPAGWVCADFGASTGGFTDALLERGAARVYAIDVGYGQLHQRIREDERVVVQERTNVRLLESLPELIDLVVVDVSFISLKLVLPVAAAVLRSGGLCVPLIKPQFEAGREQVGKGGVVREPAVHRQVIGDVLAYAADAGFHAEGLTVSPLTGPAGNVEFLAALRLRGYGGSSTAELLKQVGLHDETV